jgi:RimK-like ATP-grasp domain
MTDGGTVGESKFEILARLPADCTIPAALIPAAALADRVESARGHIERSGWRYPVIVKPDVGQRGIGVKLARTFADVADYLTHVSGAVIVQPYHSGPLEAGVFYYRFPGDARGRILSITDKHFPEVVGDGRSTLEDLIWSHSRYRMQAATFTKRHHEILGRVLPSGERFQLAIAGNHAQGTLFRDGRHLATPALTRRIDQVAQAYDGFFVGRFDIRYRNVDAFKAGEDLAIVELNGATAESTNIYDPDGSLFDAYRLLFRQWSIVFAIGAANRASGAPVTPTRRLIELVRAHLSASVPFPISD